MEARPEGQVHLGAARVGDVAQVDDVLPSRTTPSVHSRLRLSTPFTASWQWLAYSRGPVNVRVPVPAVLMPKACPEYV